MKLFFKNCIFIVCLTLSLKAAAGVKVSGGGIVVGPDILDFLNPEPRGTKLQPLETEAYQKVLAPLFSQMDRSLPKISEDLKWVLGLKTWYLVNDSIPTYDESCQVGAPLSRQDGSFVVISKKWWESHDTSLEQKAQVLLSEVLMTAYLSNENRVDDCFGKAQAAAQLIFDIFYSHKPLEDFKIRNYLTDNLILEPLGWRLTQTEVEKLSSFSSIQTLKEDCEHPEHLNQLSREELGQRYTVIYDDYVKNVMAGKFFDSSMVTPTRLAMADLSVPQIYANLVYWNYSPIYQYSSLGSFPVLQNPSNNGRACLMTESLFRRFYQIPKNKENLYVQPYFIEDYLKAFTK